MTFDKEQEYEEEYFDKTISETILESGKKVDRTINGINKLTFDKYNFKIVKNPETDKDMLVHTFGNSNYFIANTREIRFEKDLKVFGSELIKKSSTDIYICDNIMDCMILNGQLGIDSVAIFNNTDELLNSYSLFDNKKMFFISSTDKFDELKSKNNFSKAVFLKFETSILEHFKEHKNIDIINDYLIAGKSPSGIITADIDVLSKGSLISKRSIGLSSGIKNLDKQTQGFSCDMVGIGAGTGCGKTTFMMQLAAQMIKQGQKVGLMMFEQADELETLNNLAGHFDNINYNYFLGSNELELDYDYEFEELSENNNEDEEESASLTEVEKDSLVNNHLRKTVKYLSGKVEIMTNENEVENIEDALRMIRSLVIQKGCKSIFLDHTTYLTDGVENQNTAAQILMQGLMQIKNRHRVNIFYVTHLRKSKSTATHEEGARVTLDDFAGGKASTQYATVNIGLERDMHNEDESIAEITKMRLLKRRGMSVKPNSITEMKFDIDTNKIYPANCAKPICGWNNICF